MMKKRRIISYLVFISLLLTCFNSFSLVTNVSGTDTAWCWAEDYTDTGGEVNHPENILTDDGTVAGFGFGEVLEEIYDWDTTSGAGSGTTLYASIPDGATIDGITVEMEAKGVKALGGFDVYLSGDGATSFTTPKSNTFSATVLEPKTYGGTAEDWGHTWSKSNFSDANFYIKVEATGAVGQEADYIKVKVTYTKVSNTAPSINTSTESPTSGSTDVSDNPQLKAYIEDADSDQMTYWINVSIDGNNTYFCAETSTSYDGWVDVTLSNMTWDNATYYWSVAANDGTVTTTEYFYFNLSQSTYDNTSWLTAGTIVSLGWIDSSLNPVEVSDLNAVDAAYARDLLTISTDSGYLNLTDFSVNLPFGSTIKGLEILLHESSNQAGSVYRNYSFILDDDGSPTGTNMTPYSVYDTIDATLADYEWNTIPLNGTTESSWGASLTESMVEDSDFGISLKYGAIGNRQVNVDYAAIRVWYEESTYSYEEGSGTYEDPYHIYNWTDLQYVRNNLYSDFILMNDLDENTDGYDEYAGPTANDGEGWVAIGGFDIQGKLPFTGNFSGQNYTIYDFYINRTDYLYEDGYNINNINNALFGALGFRLEEDMLGHDITIRDLNMVDINVSANRGSAGIAGFGNYRVIFKNCHVTGNASGSHDVALLAGNIHGNVSNCSVVGNVVAEAYSGVFVGDYNGAAGSKVFENCYANGTISFRDAGHAFCDAIGGFAGCVRGNVTFSNNYANVNLINITSSSIGEPDKVGGLIGYTAGTDITLIKDSYYTGSIDYSGDGTGRTGALIGALGADSEIQDCFALSGSYDELINETTGTVTGRVAFASELDMKDIRLYTENGFGAYDNLNEPWDIVEDEEHYGLYSDGAWFIVNNTKMPQLWYERTPSINVSINPITQTINFSGVNWAYTNASGQTSGVCALELTNNGDIPVTVKINLNESIEGIYLVYNTSYNLPSYQYNSSYNDDNWIELGKNGSKPFAGSCTTPLIDDEIYMEIFDTTGQVDVWGNPLVVDEYLYTCGKNTSISYDGANNSKCIWIKNGTVKWEADGYSIDDPPAYLESPWNSAGPCLYYITEQPWDESSYFICQWAENGTKRWDELISDGAGYSSSGSPTIHNNIVYFGNDVYLCARNATTGAEVWTETFDEVLQCGVNYEDDFIYGATSTNSVDSSFFCVWASNGTVKWEHVGIYFNGWDMTPHVDDTYVYMGSDTNLYKFDKSDGTISENVSVSTVIGLSGDDTYIYITQNKHVKCMWKSNLTEKWTSDEFDYSTWSHPVINGDYIYVTTYYDPNAFHCIYKSNGTLKYSIDDLGHGSFGQVVISRGLAFIYADEEDDFPTYVIGDPTEYKLQSEYADNQIFVDGYTEWGDDGLNIEIPASTTQEIFLWAVYETPTIPEDGIPRLLNVTCGYPSYDNYYYEDVPITLMEANNAPTITGESPVNESTGLSISPTVYAIVTDADSDTMTCNFYTSPDGSSWTWRQTNSTVSTGTNISYVYSGASAYSTKYYWKVTADDGTDNTTSDTYEFTTGSQPTTPPTITINFAGNLSDSGGPYWRPPGESDILDEAGEGVWSDGYYTNDSRQQEDWIYINTTITDATTVYLDLLNGTTWTNGTYTLTNTVGDFWEINTSGVVSVSEGNQYSFNINATGSGGNKVTWWNKTGLGGSNTRRYVQLGCTPEDITFRPYYFYEAKYGDSDKSKKDRLHHDQGPDGTVIDTGFLRYELPGSNVEERECVIYVGYWFENSTCVEPFTLENMYFHIWWKSNTNSCEIGYEQTRGTVVSWSPEKKAIYKADSHSNLTYDSNKYYLNTNLHVEASKDITDNNMYEITPFISSGATYPGAISNRSFTSFVLFNVPDNATLNSTYLDSDSDSLSDWTELYVTYTNPFLSDTDNDGVSDYNENLSGSDPNNYTDTQEPDFSAPSITINFAGNLSDSGGPYYRPPGESTQLTGVWSDGYYTNDSWQQESWIYINLTVGDAGGVSTVYLQWRNGSTWTNNTYEFTNRSGGWFDINTSGLIQTCEGYDYSFDIRAIDSSNNEKTVWWNKTGIGGGYTRRYVQLNCIPQDVTYTPCYFHNLTYLEANKKDRLQHDQGQDGSIFDTGNMNLTIPSDVVGIVKCDGFAVHWFDETVCADSFTLDNVYFHTWWARDWSNPTAMMGYLKNREESSVSFQSGDYASNIIDNRSVIYYDNGFEDWDNNYSLHTFLVDVGDTPFTDNDIYELSVGGVAAKISYAFNRSFTSFVIFNVPNNNTLNTTDWSGDGGGMGDYDGDGLSDWAELYIRYTNPFLDDTDNDGVTDDVEVLTGSDPNNYTDTDSEYLWVDITNSSWNLGNVAMGSSTYTNETGITFIADMDVTTVNTDLKLQITNDGVQWSAATSGNGAGINTYRLNSSIDTWIAENQIVIASAVTISSNIPSGQDETFDLCFDAPTASTTGILQTITTTATLVKH